MIRCDGSKRVLIVGEVFVDRHLDVSTLRLGGLFHVARALDALQANYAAAYIGPSYLDANCQEFFTLLNAQQHCKVGNVTGAPNVIEIGESTEAGTQRYNDLLRESRKVHVDLQAVVDLVNSYQPSDLVVILGPWLNDLINGLRRPALRTYFDADHWQGETLPNISAQQTVLFSTSGTPFHRSECNPAVMREHWAGAGASTVILKENRGGSRVWQPATHGEAVQAPSFPTATRHSVGVGECFDATWVVAPEHESPEIRLRAASYVASLYASTFDHQCFVDDVRTALTLPPILADLRGVRISWEDRTSRNIYLAAPDFPQIDTRILNALEAALRYHNFTPRRPVKEHGLAEPGMSATQKRTIYAKDIDLLGKCDLLIAVPLTIDPGTFAELGWFSNTGKPTLMFDPYGLSTNLFAAGTANRYCRTLTNVIDAVFELLG